MTKPIKILVLNDASLPAMTVYDPVLQFGFQMLNRPLTKEGYQSHPSYNGLLNESSELSRRFFFEPSDLYAPVVKIDAEDEGDIPKNTVRLEGLDKWLTESGMRSLLEQSDIEGLLNKSVLEINSDQDSNSDQEPNVDHSSAESLDSSVTSNASITANSSQSAKDTCMASGAGANHAATMSAKSTHLQDSKNQDSKRAELSQEDLELSVMLQMLNQGEPNLRPLGNGHEWLNTHVDNANQEGMPEATRKANLHLVEYEDPNKEEPLKDSELTWVDRTVFFTLDDYTHVDTKFIAENFDGIFFVCHSPLGSSVLPENLLSILTECSSLGLWIFNLHLDAKLMINALNLKKGDFNFQLMQSLQTTEFKQLQVFLEKLVPRAEFVGCLTALDYEAMAAFYAYGQNASIHIPALQLSHNVYQSLHYLNQVKSLCNTGFGLASMWQQGCALSAKPRLHGIVESAHNPLEIANVDKRHAPKHHTAPNQGANVSTESEQDINTVANAKYTLLAQQTDRVERTAREDNIERADFAERAEVVEQAKSAGPAEQAGQSERRAAIANKVRANRAKASAALALQEAKLKGCSIEQFPNKLFGCPFNKLSDWKSNTLPPEQNVDNYVPHILISSKYFNFNPILGMELMGARLLVQILASFPEVNISLVFNQCVYSWLADMPKDTILWQEQGELTSHDAFIESAKATHDLMSSAMRTRVMGDLRRHILATLNDQEGWQWTLEQRHNLESLVVRFDNPSAGKIFCYPRLTEAVLNLSPDVVISDIQSDLVRARSKGLATIELVESPSQWDGLALFTRNKTYFENLALSSDIEQGAILRFSLDRIFNAQKGKTTMCSKQASTNMRNKLLLRGLAQGILCASAQAGGAALKLDKSSVYKNIKRLPSNYGFSSGYKLAWTDVLHKLDCLNHVFAEESLSEQINTCYNEHLAMIRKVGVSLNRLLDTKQAQEEQAPQFKRAQLSNFTCAKRYYLQHLGLSYLAALAHSHDFGDGATLISKVGQFELSEVWQEQVLKLTQDKQVSAKANQGILEVTTSATATTTITTTDTTTDASDITYQQPRACKELVSELTQAFIKHDTQWPVFKPLSLSVLSFGCSRGDEVFDLMPLFNGQRFTGIDINEGAIKLAQQQLMNLHEVSLEQSQEAFNELYALPQLVLNDSSSSRELQEALSGIKDKLSACLQEFVPQRTHSGQDAKSDHLDAVASKLESMIPLVGQTGDGVGSKKAAEAKAKTCAKAKTKAAQDSLAREGQADRVGGVTKSSAQNKHPRLETEGTSCHTAKTRESSPNHPCTTGTTGTTSALQPRLVQYLGSMGLVNFVSSKEFFAQYADKPLPQFDVVTAMTVLCRHPETMFLLNANEVYPFSEFMDTLNLLDSMVKPGGLLCLFNSNYLLEDSPLASKYVGVYPFKLKPKIQETEDTIATTLSSSLSKVASQWFAADKGANGVAEKTGTGRTKEAAGTVGTTEIAEVASAGSANSEFFLPLPRHYAEIYRERGQFEKGHVALFNPDGSLCAPRREEAMIIYYKKPDCK